MLDQIRKLAPKTVLDVGAGEGTYLSLAHRRGQHWTAVESWEPYVAKYELEKRYDRVIRGDVRSIEWPDVDLVIFGDVLEHMTHADALAVWNEARKHSRYILLSIPIVPYPQGPVGGNPYEEHRSTWMHGECVELPGVIASRKLRSIGCYLATGKPEVTIVVTTCNRPEYLYQCVASMPQVPVIVIADPQRTGTSATRMRGLAQVTTPYFAFFDDDDVMLPNWLPTHLAKMREGYDVVSSSYWYTDANLRRTEERILKEPTFADLREGYVTVNDGSLIRRSALEGLTWHPEREDAMMLSMWLDLAKKGARFAMIEEPTWLYRRHEGNKTNVVDERDAAIRAQVLAEYA
jgi:SAM-dependent methyltransferase